MYREYHVFIPSHDDCIQNECSSNVILIMFVFLAVQVEFLLVMPAANAFYFSLVLLIFCKVTGLRKN